MLRTPLAKRRNRGTNRTHIASVIITVSLGGIKTALANFISNGEAMCLCTRPGRLTFSILYAKAMFDILIEELTTTWFDDHNNDSEKREFILFSTR